MKDPKETLRNALASAAFLAEKDPDFEKPETLDQIEADIHAAKVALEALLPDDY